LNAVKFPPLPHDVEDQLWLAVKKVMMFMADERICRYLMHPEKGLQRNMNMMEGRDDPDEWTLMCDVDPRFDGEYSDDVWASAGEVSWVSVDPPVDGVDGEGTA
jgi:hypothetical protein